jgi:hypothetical protein
MRRPGILLGFLFSALIAAGAIWLTTSSRRSPVAVKVVHLESSTDTEQKWVEVSLEFTRHGPDCGFFVKGLTIQTMAEGCWSGPERFFGFIGDRSLLSTNRVYVSLMIPRQTEACRFLLAYHIGDSPHGTAQNYFFKHGWIQTCPRLCQYVLLALPDRIRWKQTILEVKLPRQQPQSASLPLGPIFFRRRARCWTVGTGSGKPLSWESRPWMRCNSLLWPRRKQPGHISTMPSARTAAFTPLHPVCEEICEHPFPAQPF